MLEPGLYRLDPLRLIEEAKQTSMICRECGETMPKFPVERMIVHSMQHLEGDDRQELQAILDSIARTRRLSPEERRAELLQHLCLLANDHSCTVEDVELALLLNLPEGLAPTL